MMGVGSATDWVSPILNHKYFNMVFIALALLVSTFAWINIPFTTKIITAMNWSLFVPICQLASLFCGMFLLVLAAHTVAKRLKQLVSQEASYKNEIVGLKKTIDAHVAEILRLRSVNLCLEKCVSTIQKALNCFEPKVEGVIQGEMYVAASNNYVMQTQKTMNESLP